MKLNRTAVAQEIGTVVMVLTEGADLTLDLKQLLADGKAANWKSFGNDLGNLASWLKNTGCTSFVCTMLEGLLDAAAIPFQARRETAVTAVTVVTVVTFQARRATSLTLHCRPPAFMQSLTACVGDIRSAETALAAGTEAFSQRKFVAALTYWGNGLHQIADSVADCHLTDELEFISQEAQVRCCTTRGLRSVAHLPPPASCVVDARVAGRTHRTWASPSLLSAPRPTPRDPRPTTRDP